MITFELAPLCCVRAIKEYKTLEIKLFSGYLRFYKQANTGTRIERNGSHG